MMVALRVALQHALEVAEIFRDAVPDKIGSAAASFVLLILVIKARGDRVMGIVRLVDDVGDRQLQLMRPQPLDLIARREAVAPPKV